MIVPSPYDETWWGKLILIVVPFLILGLLGLILGLSKKIVSGFIGELKYKLLEGLFWGSLPVAFVIAYLIHVRTEHLIADWGTLLIVSVLFIVGIQVMWGAIKKYRNPPKIGHK